MLRPGFEPLLGAGEAPRRRRSIGGEVLEYSARGTNEPRGSFCDPLGLCRAADQRGIGQEPLADPSDSFHAVFVASIRPKPILCRFSAGRKSPVERNSDLGGKASE